jgi:hypothetical protein
MGSMRFRGVRFVAYTMEHEPRHVHGFYAETEVVVDLLRDGSVALALRKDVVNTPNASKSDVRHVLTVAADHFDELVILRERHHA